MFALVLSGLYFTCCSDVAVSGKNHYEGPIDTAMLKIHVSDSISEAWLLYPVTRHIDCGRWWCACSGIQLSMKLPDAILKRLFLCMCVWITHTFRSLIINRQVEYFFFPTAISISAEMKPDGEMYRLDSSTVGRKMDKSKVKCDLAIAASHTLFQRACVLLQTTVMGRTRLD